MTFCANCGSPVEDGTKFCGGCGKPVTGAPNEYAVPTVQPQVTTAAQTQSTMAYPPGYVPKKWLTALLLCIFLGFGHRFYTGKIGTGILMLLLDLTGWACLSEAAIQPLLLIFLAGYYVWWIIDLVYICTGKFTDARGYVLKK